MIYKFSMKLFPPLIVGTLAFFAVVGPRVLAPSNIAWLAVDGDPASHYLGWEFFRNSPWSFPLGLNPMYGLDLSSSIVYSDSNPLLAFLFKVFSPVLSDPFQYFGLWLYLCFVLQAYFGWKLVGLYSNHLVSRILAAGLFVFAPPFLFTLQTPQKGHLSLFGHFLLLAALFILLRTNRDYRAGLWGLLLATTALIHAYLLAVVALLWLADLLEGALAGERRRMAAAGEIIAIVSIVGVLCWQAGYFAIEGEVSASGYGVYRMNALSMFDPSGWSYIIVDLPERHGDYEGFAYLGLGIILLFLLAAPPLISNSAYLSLVAKRPILLAALLGLTLFAISHKIGIGQTTFELELPTALVEAASTFRSSGRMFWVVFYGLLLGVIYIILRAYGPKPAALILTVGLATQIIDTHAGWRDIRLKFMTEPASEWPTPLRASFWKAAAAKYSKVSRVLPQNLAPHWQPFASYAATHNMGTDMVYLARVGDRQLQVARKKAMIALHTGKFERDSLYIVDPKIVAEALPQIDQSRDLLTKVDGFDVLAPEWKIQK